MNKLDKKVQRALTFFANTSSKDIQIQIKQDSLKYQKVVAHNTEKYLVRLGYINTKEQQFGYIITKDGLEQLRLLDNIQVQEYSLFSSIIAVILALIALFK